MELGTTNAAGPRAAAQPAQPGKSAQAPGQLAKQAIAAARAAGVELPRNAQGVAASAIARGADPSSVFAAQAVPEDGADTGTQTDAATGGEMAAEAGTGAPVAADAYDAAASAIAAPALSEDETALQLLM